MGGLLRIQLGSFAVSSMMTAQNGEVHGVVGQDRVGAGCRGRGVERCGGRGPRGEEAV